MYAHDLVSTIKVIADLLDDDGVLVFSVPPFRFAILRKEIEDWGHGFAYNKQRATGTLSMESRGFLSTTTSPKNMT
jgi:hypothetical protein